MEVCITEADKILISVGIIVGIVVSGICIYASSEQFIILFGLSAIIVLYIFGF